jgi:DNA-binding FrmR family transcriptional regulator
MYPRGVSWRAMQADNRAILNRLRRIEGQVRGLQRMVDEDAYCIDILTQVAAVQTALENVAVEVLDGHVRHCVADAVKGGDDGEAKLDELMAAVRRFTKAR